MSLYKFNDTFAITLSGTNINIYINQSNIAHAVDKEYKYSDISDGNISV